MASRFTERNHLPELIASWDEIQDGYLEKVGEATVEQIQQGFDKGEDALGRSWEPLQDPDSGEILVDTGTLRESIQFQVDEDSKDVAIGSDVEYIAYHEFGTETLPRRPILQPAATWMEGTLSDPLAEKAIGEKIDVFTF